jgi:hypothetical protein
MARVEITSAVTGGGGGGGNLQLSGGASMSATLTAVTDTSNVASPLQLSTTLVKVTSTLRITTADNPYIDAEDSSGNNRFTIGRDPASQQVNVDFASNPTGSTTYVGAIRTYTDGVNLGEVVSFREDGFTFFKAQTYYFAVKNADSGSDYFWNDINPNITAGANNQVVSLVRLRDRGVANTGGFTGTQRLSLIMENAAGGQFPFQLFSETGNLRIGFPSVATPTALVHLQGTGSTSATKSLLIQNSSGTQSFKVEDGGSVQIGLTSGIYWTFSSNTLTSSQYAFIAGSNGSVLSSGAINGGVFGNNNGGKVADSSIATPQVASAVLEVSSTTRGFLPPRMTDAQRAAIASPAEGLLVYNTDNHAVAYRDGTNWGYLCGALQNATGSGGTLAILFASGNIVNLTLNASTTLTFSGHVVGTYIIQVTQGGGGSNTLTYPASVKWSGGTPPTLTTAVGKTDILTFYHDGTSFFGTYSLNY